MFSPTLLRYIFTGYLVRTSVVMLTLLTVALAIDLQANQKQVLSVGQLDGPLEKAIRIFWYATLRASDIVSRLLGIAAFLGVFWSEFSQNRSKERVAVWNCGVTPLRAMVPALVFGTFLVGIQATLEFLVRPAAVLTQIDSGLGAYGERYRPAATEKPVWFVAGSDLIATQIDYDPPASLQNTVVYRLSDTNRLLGVMTANRGQATRQDGIWSLTGTQQWTVNEAVNKLNIGDADVQLDVALAIDPLWLRYRTVAARYLSQETINRFVRQDAVGVRPAEYKTWAVARYSKSLMPALFVVLAYSIGVFSFGRPATLPSFMLYFPQRIPAACTVQNMHSPVRIWRDFSNSHICFAGSHDRRDCRDRATTLQPVRTCSFRFLGAGATTGTTKTRPVQTRHHRDAAIATSGQRASGSGSGPSTGRMRSLRYFPLSKSTPNTST